MFIYLFAWVILKGSFDFLEESNLIAWDYLITELGAGPMWLEWRLLARLGGLQ